ncbi:helix-turn-helix domain-containing protein [Rhodococcus aetherivorans]|uniref:helix-turn-helix domain-containing protein n=1 Tax=Rhodococcus aetherivorans TaxID=191292 RepID=UPI0036C42948
MYRKIELRGRQGFEAMASDAGSRTELSVPDVTQFRFRMEICNVGAISVGRVQMSPHRALAGVVEDGEVANLFLMLTGERVVDDGTTRVHVKSGRIVLQVGWNRYEAADADGSDLLLVRIPRHRLEERGLDLEETAVTFGPAKPTMSTHALNAVGMAMLRERGRHNTTAAPRGVENALIELVVGLHHESLGYGADSGELCGSAYTRALTLVRAHHSDPRLTPTVIAERLQISLRSLQRAFAAHDTTVASQIRRLRAHRAAVLLQEPAYARTTVAEIAAIAGFASSAELRRALRAVRGVSPSELRPH